MMLLRFRQSVVITHCSLWADVTPMAAVILHTRSGLLRIYEIRHAACGRYLTEPFFRRTGFPGVAVSSDQMKPGDLIFYGNGRSINHVAMYIGNGQIVHSSTTKRNQGFSVELPDSVKIVNVIGE